MVFGEGLGITGNAKYWMPALGGGFVAWQNHQANSAYEDSRTAKPWDHPDMQTRLGMNQTARSLVVPLNRPVIKSLTNHN